MSSHATPHSALLPAQQSPSQPAPQPKRLPYGSHRGNRIDLATALPLATPLSILIDPSNACNYRCFFCAQSDKEGLRQVGRPKGMMAWELFEKIVADLGEFAEPIKSVHLYKDGEPLANPLFPDMVHRLSSAGVARYIETTTNGSLLRPALVDRLLGVGLDGIRISVYATSDEGYAKTTRSRTKYAEIVENVRYLRQRRDVTAAPLHIHCKIINTPGNPIDRDQFLADFGPLADSVYVHPIHGNPLQVPDFQVIPDRGRQVCSEPFLKLAINFDGQVSVCCSDWAMRTIVGDVRQSSIQEIWNGNALREFRLIHLRGRRADIPACNGCGYVQTLPTDNNLDAIAEELLGRYQGPPPQAR